MPLRIRPAPRDKALTRCLRESRAAADPNDIGKAWKAFRRSKCGKAWFKALTRTYGLRCSYCDHSPAFTVEHVMAKSRRLDSVFKWSNWLPACDACNRLKNAVQTVLNPLRGDPRDYFVFDLLTGAPIVDPSGDAKKVRIARQTVDKLCLDNQVLNDARRVQRLRMMSALADVALGKASATKAALDLLSDLEPHRAIVRDLILENDPALNPYAGLVARAVAVMPELLTWAKRPV